MDHIFTCYWTTIIITWNETALNRMSLNKKVSLLDWFGKERNMPREFSINWLTGWPCNRVLLKTLSPCIPTHSNKKILTWGPDIQARSKSDCYIAIGLISVITKGWNWWISFRRLASLTFFMLWVYLCKYEIKNWIRCLKLCRWFRGWKNIHLQLIFEIGLRKDLWVSGGSF